MHNLSGTDKYKGTKTMDKEIVANFENLYRSYKKVKNGKKFNSGTERFSNMSLEGIQILKEQLENQTYSISPWAESRQRKKEKNLKKLIE